MSKKCCVLFFSKGAGRVVALEFYYESYAIQYRDKLRDMGIAADVFWLTDATIAGLKTKR